MSPELKVSAPRLERAFLSLVGISNRTPIAGLLIGLLTLPLGAPAVRAASFEAAPAVSAQAVSTELGISRQEAVPAGQPRHDVQLRLGERIYREGLLPSGQPLQAVVKGDVAVDGRMFSCVNCHRRSGMGSVEGGITTPANAGSKLFQPSYFGREFTPAERSALPEHYRTALRRPAYTDATLARAIRDGIDPTGRVLNPVMPRYTLSDSDLAVLISYLKSLSSEPSPGVSETTLRFATVVGSGVPDRDSAAMLATLDAFVADWNSRAKMHAERARFPEIAQEADLSYRSISLVRWQLDGAAPTWRSQLEARNAKEPVFALLGGIATEEWQPVRDFSEAHQIPTILPITDFPVVSGSDWYTLYFSKGLYQEGETAAASLGRSREVAAEDSVVQVFRDTKEGRALAVGFEATWRSLGRKPPVNRILSADGPLPQDLIGKLTGKEMPQVLLLWLGSEAAPVLERLAEGERRPKAVYLSAGLLGPGIWTLPEPVREFASFTFPYRLPQDEAMHPDYAKVWLAASGLAVDDRRISTRMYTLMLLMNQAIPKMRRNFYRDNLLDQIDLSTVHGYPDFDRLSFGPGQRYASKECHIVTLSRGPNPILIKKSD